MRRTVISLVAVAAFAIAGCSDSDNDTDADSDNGDESSATTAPEEGGGGESGDAAEVGGDEDFCATFEELITSGSAATDDEALSAMRSVEVPEDIADEYPIFVESVEAQVNIDPEDEEAVAEFQERAGEFEEASGAVEGYVTDECGIDTAAEPPAEDGAGATESVPQESGGDIESPPAGD